MRYYYECHVTFMAEQDPQIKGWKFSAIDGDPVLGAGVKSYLTKQFRCVKPRDEVIAEVEFAAGQLRDEGLKVLRTKVELVLYDRRHR